MISVAEAEAIILQDPKMFSSVKIPLENAYGRILQEDIFADRDLPPFHRVAMDGIAINFSSWQQGQRRFPIENIQSAGSPQLSLNHHNACIEVMTGAMLPIGCDSIIPVENIKVVEKEANLTEGYKITLMQNVHSQASDYKKNCILLEKGCTLLPPQIAVIASVGKAKILVTSIPKIAIIGTGNELVDIDQNIEPYQIRQSNAYALQSTLNLHGYNQTKRFHLQDDKNILLERLKNILEEYDLIILSGGVSMGKFDFVPEVLKELEVKVLFHKVKQRPGKPFWFGKSKEGNPVFALPGNPVATQIGVYRYILPYLNKAMLKNSVSEEYGILNQDVNIKIPFTYFLPVNIHCQPQGQINLSPVHTHGSGDFATLTKSDGFMELKADTFSFPKSSPYRFYRWKN